MVLLVNMILALIAAVLIFWPFLNKEEPVDYFAGNSTSDFKERELLFSSLGEIEFDYRMNKLNKEDYQLLKETHQEQALKVLSQEDKDLDMEVKSELKKLRNRQKRVKSEEESNEQES